MKISAKTCLMLLCQRFNNHYTTTNYSCCLNTNIVAALYAGSWYRQRLSNHHTTTDYFCCNIIKGTTSTTRWLFANTLYGWREYPFLVITFTSASLFAGASTAGVVVRFLLVHLLLPDFPQAESHPEPAPRSLRRRISPAQTKGEYQYED